MSTSFLLLDLFDRRGHAALCRPLGGALLALAMVAGTHGQGTPGQVLYHEKISVSSGGTFGGAVELLSDLDGDGIEELAVGAHDTGNPAGTGAVWILFLNRDGTVREEVLLPTPTEVTTTEEYGLAIATLGDLDGSGPSVQAIAVGAVGDEGTVGATDTGAIYVCFLDASGNELVGFRKKIANGTPGFGAPLNGGDRFGHGLEALGSPEGDGIVELAVGAIQDDEHAANSGALWLLQIDSTGAVLAADKMLPPAGVGAGAQYGSDLALLGDLAGNAGLALAVGARQDVPGVNNGAVWILFLDAFLQTVASTKLNGLAGFPTQVDSGDTFGNSAAGLGYLDDSGLYVLAVGAPFDDPQSFAGSAFLLFLDVTGTTVSIDHYLYVTEGSSGFTGDLGGNDLFGESVCAIGDLDGDGRQDLAVGAAWDDDLGTNRGAVWILFLNDGSIDLSSTTTWEGDSSGNEDDWNRNQNWSNSRPISTTTAIIPSGGVQPLIRTGTAAVCHHLIIRPGASVTTQSGSSTLAIHGGATLHGSLSGPGPVTFAGAGTLAGTASLAATAGLTFNADVSVQGGPVLVGSGTTLTVNQDLTIEAGAELECDGPVLLNSGGNGVLSGPGTLDCDGSLTLNLGSTEPPRIEVAGNLSLNSGAGRFQPNSGTLRLDGASPQTVTQLGGAIPIQLHDLELGPTADVLFQQDLVVEGGTLWEGIGDSTGSVTFEGNVRTDPAFSAGEAGESRRTVPTIRGGDIYTYSDILNVGGLLDPRGRLVIDTSGGVAVHVSNGVFGDVEVQGTGIATFESGAFTATGSFDIQGGTVVTDGDLDLTVQSLSIANPGALDVQGNRIDVLGNPPMAVLGDLRVAPGGTLGLSACPITVGNGGLLRIAGASGNPATLREADSTGGYTVTLQSGATLEAGEFLLRSPGAGGLKLEPGALLGTAPLDLRSGTFDLIANAAGALFLDIERSPSQEVELFDLRFEGGIPGTTYNVRVPAASARVLLTNWSGGFGGPAYEDTGNDDFAEWGTKMLSLFVHERSSGNTLQWRTSRRGEADMYVLERAPVPGAFAHLADVPPAGPLVGLQTYQHFDPSPGSAWRYQLWERFPGGSLRSLGIVEVDGVPNPSHLPAGSTPLSLPMHAGGGPVTSPTGVHDSLQAALSAGSDGDVLALELPPGVLPAFEVRGRSAILRAARPSESWIDVSAGPVRIVGLAADESVELVGLRFVGARPGTPAIVVEDCHGLVRCTDIQADELHVHATRSLLLRECELGRLQLWPGARAFALGGSLAVLALAQHARLESSGLTGALVQQGAGLWLSARQAAATLVLLEEHEDGLELELRAPAGAHAWILAAPRPGFGEVASGIPLQLDRRVLVRSPLQRVGSSGVLALDLARASTGEALYLQALVLDPRSGRVGLTDLVRAGAR